jgi:hypothetical protein
MKKLIFSILLAVSGTLFAGDYKILMMDTNDLRSYVPSSIVITNGAVVTTTNSISKEAVQGVTSSSGAGDANKVVKLNSSGLIDSTMFTGTTVSATNMYLAATVNSASSYTEILRFTNTITSGTRVISGQTLFSDSSASSSASHIFGRLLEVSIDLGTTNVISSCGYTPISSGTRDTLMAFTPIVRTVSSTNIYIIQGQSDVTGDGESFRNSGTSVVSGNPAFSNATYISIINIR